MSNNTGKSCLPPCNKKALKRALPFSTSEKRECITTWWNNVCNKVHQHQITQSRNQMHKTLEKLLRQQQQDVESKIPSPASASIGVINQTAATSVTHINLDDDEEEQPSTGGTTLREKRRVSIGKAFDDFQNKTKVKQAETLEQCNEKKRILNQEQKEVRQKRERQRLLLQQWNFCCYRKQRKLEELAEKERQEKRQQEKEKRQYYRRGYQANLAPLIEEEEEEEPETQAAPQAAPRVAPQLVTVNGNNNNEADQEANNTSGESSSSIPARVPGPAVFNFENNFLDYDFDTSNSESGNTNNSNNNNAQLEETSLTPAAEYARSIRNSLRLISASSYKTANSHNSSDISGHSTDPVAELRQSTHMNAHIENRHDGTSPSPVSSTTSLHTAAEGELEQQEEQQQEEQQQEQQQPVLPPNTIITANATSIFLEPNNVAAQGEIVQPLHNNPMFSDAEQVNYYMARQQYERRLLQRPQVPETGRPRQATRIPHQMVMSRRERMLRFTIALRLPYIEKLIKDFRDNFTAEIAYSLHNHRLFKTSNFLLKYEYIQRGIIGDGINGGVRVVRKIKHINFNAFKSKMPEYAVKSIRVNYPSERERQAILNEIKIMDKARGDTNLMSFKELFYENDRVVILMNRMEGDLCDYIRYLNRPLPPNIALYVFNNIVKGLYYLHYDIGYFHGDIKPENILLDAKGQIKITDFGFSSHLGVVTESRCGTLGYMAPEVYLHRQFSEKSDLWSLGMTLLSMLELHLPEIEEDDFITAEFIDIYMMFNMALRDMEHIPFLMYIFRYCLVLDPTERCSIMELDDYLVKYDCHLPTASSSEYRQFIIDNSPRNNTPS